jgi:hypothetical protein
MLTLTHRMKLETLDDRRGAGGKAETDMIVE